MATAELQKMYDELTPEGKAQFETTKKAVGIFLESDPSIPFFLCFESQLDRMEKFPPKLAETVRKSAYEVREDSVKCAQITMAQVVEKGLKTATQEMTAEHAAAMRELTSEATQVIRQSQPPTKNWRFVASVALIAQVGLLSAVNYSSWWYRGHQDAQTAAWSQTFEGRQAAEFYAIIQKSVPNPAFLHSSSALKNIRSVLAWAVSQDGVTAWTDYENTHKRKK